MRNDARRDVRDAKRRISVVRSSDCRAKTFSYKMAVEMLKKFFYNLFSYFSNGETNASVEICETLVLQSASTGPDGSSVDLDPLHVASESDAADPKAAKTASRAFVEDSSSPEGRGEHRKPQDVGNARDVDKALPKWSLCADSLSQDLSTAVGNDSSNVKCTADVEAEGDERDKLCPTENVSSDETFPVSNTSNFTEEEKSGCRVTEKEALAVECSEHSEVENFSSINQDSAETEHLIQAFPPI